MQRSRDVGGVRSSSEVQALHEARRCGVSRRMRLSKHARMESLPDRNLTMQDVFSALANARDCISDGPDKWRVFGPSLDEDELQVIVKFDPDAFVITVYGVI